MKSLIIAVLVVMLMGSSLLMAQEEEQNIEIIIDDAMKDLELEMEAGEKTIIINQLKGYDPNTPKMGVFLADLDFKDIYELHYDYNYGVYLTGVTTNGPSDKAGLMEGDIIMEFDGKKIRFEDHLVRMIQSRKIGDEVKIKFFRDEQIYETNLVLNTLDKKGDDLDLSPGLKKKKKIYVGHGGGGWVPVWFMPDVTEINSMLSDLGFKEETFSEDGFLLQGGAGKGFVGKGWFIGGIGAGYSNKETSKHEWTHYLNGEEVTSTRFT